MKAWLKGGLWGLSVGIVLFTYPLLLSLIATFEGPYPNKYYFIVSFILTLLYGFFRLILFFLVGALIGWISKNWEKITGKSKEKKITVVEL